MPNVLSFWMNINYNEQNEIWDRRKNAMPRELCTVVHRIIWLLLKTTFYVELMKHWDYKSPALWNELSSIILCFKHALVYYNICGLETCFILSLRKKY